ncbi:hypothetical protein BHE74_00037844 [Ensete ventricosum]|nr:hypothetical protein BHE74_00037844 [Ensete ventricosum]RZR94770.1 hypothetical protein BHM03_00023556 [Ensete ventricosum]
MIAERRIFVGHLGSLALSRISICHVIITRGKDRVYDHRRSPRNSRDPVHDYGRSPHRSRSASPQDKTKHREGSYSQSPAGSRSRSRSPEALPSKPSRRERSLSVSE